MKKILGVALSIVLCMALMLAFVGCSNNNSGDSSDAATRVVYSVETDDDGNDYAIVDKYALSEADAKKVSNNDYADIMVDLEINVYTDENGNKYPVKEIAPSAFANQLTIKSIKFGENVETFGSACLAGCANLESLTVPFVGNKKDAVNDGKLLGYLFGTASSAGSTNVTMSYNATGSKSYYVPNKLKTVTVTGDTLSAYAFNGLNLTTVNLSGNVETIGDHAFSNMPKLTSYTIPASVKTIGNYAFSNCANLAKIDFSQATALSSVGDHAFEGCVLLGYGKASTVTFPASVQYLGAKAFYNCSELTAVDLSVSAVATLNEYAFYGCDKLASVKLKMNTALSLGTFASCKALKTENIVNYDSATGKEIAFDIEA